MSLLQKCYDFTRADEIKEAGFYPYFRPIEESEGPVVQIEGRKVVMAGSNNYLGLTNHPKVKEAAIKAIEKYGTGCSVSRYLTGTIDLHVELEDKLAKFLNKEAVLLFSTGYQTAQGIIPTLVQRGEYIISDKDIGALNKDFSRDFYEKYSSLLQLTLDFWNSDKANFDKFWYVDLIWDLLNKKKEWKFYTEADQLEIHEFKKS